MRRHHRRRSALTFKPRVTRILRMRAVDYFRPTSTGVTNHEYRNQHSLFVHRLPRLGLHLRLPGNLDH